MTDTPFPTEPREVQSILDEWARLGLLPKTVPEADLMQTIVIEHNRITGHYDIRANGVTLMQVISLLADGVFSVWRTATQGKQPPTLSGPKTKVCLEFEDGVLSISTASETGIEGAGQADPIMAKAVLACAIYALSEQTSAGTFNPLDALLGRLTIKTGDAPQT